MAIQALEEIQQYRAIGTVEGYELAINESIDKHNLMIVYKDRLKEFEAIGTIEEFKALKENQRKCEECAGCTAWNCDCVNERAKAIDEFAERLKYKWIDTWDLNLFSSFREFVDEIAEQMKGGGNDG
jgi:hypothetical protein